MHGLSGSLVVNRSIFERWGEYDRLRFDMQSVCAILSLRTGLDFQLHEESLVAAHTRWHQEMQLWLRDLLPDSTKELSHLKKISIFLAKLCEGGCITVSGGGHFVDPPVDHTKTDFLPAPTRVPTDDIKKFKDGGCAYVGWLITYHVCEFFEQRRRDKDDPYVSRITEEFEIDMVSGLLSKQLSAQAIHLILKALFLRD